MAKLTLLIGNKNYSSWSLRPYMALAQSGIPFEEKLVRLNHPSFAPTVKKYSPAGRVPVVIDGDIHVWDSLAIMEYLAERFPAKNLWPKNRAARAMARSVSAEMHSGFSALRNACPMNLRRPLRAIPLSAAVMKDVARIEKLWSDCRKAHGKGGPFLFGKFTAADAMFTPVATRLETFAIPVKPETRKYMDALFATKAFQAWKKAALQEKWIVAEDEVD